MVADAPVVERALAKVNLHLHITGRRADGYHLIDSLVVFPDVGDVLEASPAAELTLSVEGPFAGDLPAEADNLVLRAARALAPGRGAALRLIKNLPVASGIGGGSADAAATLRALNRLWGLALGETALERFGAGIGADVAACVRSRPTLMRGVGEVLEDGPAIGPLPLVLVNPGVAVSTREVFGMRTGGFSIRVDPPRSGDPTSVVRWLADQRNDLESAAIARHPEIADVLAALRPDALLARMSGSGATCFALYDSEAAATTAAEGVRATRPDWWVATTRV